MADSLISNNAKDVVGFAAIKNQLTFTRISIRAVTGLGLVPFPVGH